MGNKLKSIITNETRGFINELIDPNAGGLYQPPGLDPSVVKLFEDADEIYHNSLNDKYWTEISSKFPEYNNPNSDDNKQAVNYIIKNMKQKYPDKNWEKIEEPMRKKVHASIS